MKFWRVSAAALIASASSAFAANTKVVIVKMPVKVQTRIFDPKRPPADMPPFEPPETAECDSEFLSDASVGGEARLSDATHAKLTLTKIKVTLQLNVVIWLPTNKFKKLEDHEKGHERISETYYKDAEIVARQIAEPYIGNVVDVSGPDLRKAVSAILDKTGDEITKEYIKETPVETTQLLYDKINEHGVNDVPVDDAIAQAMKATFPNRAATKPATP
jgi:hypothetical protein